MRLFFWPVLLFGGFLKFLIIVAVVVLIVRLVTHRHGHSGHWHGYGHANGWPPENTDPRRIAAMRYASGRIDRAEFDHIMSTLDATAPGAPAPPQAPSA
jgi:uncharacterized membrane protein